MEVLGRVRDLLVSTVRTDLLSGVFIGNPDNLEVVGEIASNRITLTVVDSSKRRFQRTLDFRDFSKFVDAPLEGDEGQPSEVGAGPTPAIGSNVVMDDNPLMPRLALTPVVTEDQFRSVRPRADMLRGRVMETARSLAKDYVREFLAVKSSRRR